MVPIQKNIDGEVWPSMQQEQHKVFNGDYLFRQATEIRVEKTAMKYLIFSCYGIKIPETYVGKANTTGI